MGELKPPVLVIPNPLGADRVTECVPIEVEYLQEDDAWEAVDCHNSSKFSGLLVKN
jgi:hypothetical protein